MFDLIQFSMRKTDLYRNKGYHKKTLPGEKVTQLQHAQQAAQHAKEAGGADHVILGAFLHDIGHLIGREKKLETVRVRI